MKNENERNKGDRIPRFPQKNGSRTHTAVRLNLVVTGAKSERKLSYLEHSKQLLRLSVIKHNSQRLSLHYYVGDDVPATSLFRALACTFTQVSRCSGQCSCWCFMQQ
jgi:hypothetical protein